MPSSCNAQQCRQMQQSCTACGQHSHPVQLPFQTLCKGGCSKHHSFLPNCLSSLLGCVSSVRGTAQAHTVSLQIVTSESVSRVADRFGAVGCCGSAGRSVGPGLESSWVGSVNQAVAREVDWSAGLLQSVGLSEVSQLDWSVA